MMTLGILGGMSWESTASYYRLLNEGVRQQRGGLHSAPLLLASVDFAGIAHWQSRDDWEQAGRFLAETAQGLERAGAGALLLATNTMHKVAADIESAVTIPLLHIGDAVGQILKDQGVDRAALLGTRFTMQQDFYQARLANRYGIDVMVPDADEMDEVNRIIYDELCVGTLRDESRRRYLQIIERLAAAGAQTIILGCTEIGLLVHQEDTAVPLLDTTQAHVRMGLDWLAGDHR